MGVNRLTLVFKKQICTQICTEMHLGIVMANCIGKLHFVLYSAWGLLFLRWIGLVIKILRIISFKNFEKENAQFHIHNSFILRRTYAFLIRSLRALVHSPN